jgi:hypothetical protein
MTKQVAAVIAFLVAWIATLLISAKVAKGDSTQPDHVLLQTRQDIGSIYACLTITNGLLAAILASILF